MDIARRRTDLPPEVLAAIGDFMHHRRRDSTPLIMTEVMEAVRLIFPKLSMVKSELSEAITEAAAAGRVSIYSDRPPDAGADTRLPADQASR